MLTTGWRRRMEAAVNLAGGLPQGGTFPLAAAGRQDRLRVCKIKGRDDTRKFLADLGFVEGAEISVVSQQGGNLIADVKGSRIALSQQMACRVLVCDA